MEIINVDTDKNIRYKTAVGLGNFDGFHRGHQELVSNLVELARERNLRPALLLFTDHTKKTIDKKEPEIITTLEDKVELAREAGIEIIFSMTFTEDVMKLSSEEFVEEILRGKLNAHLVAAGFDYRFGYKAEGNIDSLKKYCGEDGLNVFALKPVTVHGNLVSSSLIRHLMKKGDIKTANGLLGREYSLKGTVIHGEKRGSKMGFPTANLQFDNSILIPKTGVYKTKAVVAGKEYKSLTNIGYNPTFDGDELRIETHIIGFSEDIYSKEIEIFFKDYIREDIKFADAEGLMKQMQADLKAVQS